MLGLASTHRDGGTMPWYRQRICPCLSHWQAACEALFEPSVRQTSRPRAEPRWSPRVAPRTRAASSTSAAETPVDLTHYADRAKAREAPAASGAGGAPEVAMSSRFSITRRPALDLRPDDVRHAQVSGELSRPADLPLASGRRSSGAAEPHAAEPDVDLHKKFDVPAFLRRQEN